MRIIRRSCYLLLILAMGGAGQRLPDPQGVLAQASHNPASRSSISVTIGALQDPIPVGSPVKVKAVVTNNSSGKIYLWFFDVGKQVAPVYGVNVRDTDGNQPPDTEMGRVLKYNAHNSPNIGRGTMLGGSGAFIPLMPGQSDVDVIDVSERYDFSQPGEYSIQLERAAWHETALAQSNTILVHVVPVQGAAAVAPSTGAAPPFELSIRGPDAPVDSSSPVGILVTTKNTSNQRILLWGEKAERDQAGVTYRVEVRDANGKLLPETKYGLQIKSRTDIPNEANPKAFSGSNGERLVLRAGESWNDTIKINDLYDLREPGQYTIQVERFDPATSTMVKSNEVTITVIP